MRSGLQISLTRQSPARHKAELYYEDDSLVSKLTYQIAQRTRPVRSR